MATINVSDDTLRLFNRVRMARFCMTAESGMQALLRY